MTRSYWIAEVLAWVDRFKSEKLRPAVLTYSGLWSVFKIFEWKNHTSRLTLMWIVVWHYRGFIFENYPLSVPLCAPTMQTTGKRQFSLICGSPELGSGPWNEFISPQCDANEWFYSSITPCHNQLCILKREEMRRSVYRSTRQWLAIQMDGKDPRRNKKPSYPVFLRWLCKEFHFAVTSFSIMEKFGLFHSLTLFSHFYCIEFLISKHCYL